MAKITIKPLSGGYNLQSIGENLENIANQLNTKVYYRSNPTGEPNTLETPMDVNGKRVYNLPAPAGLNDAARLQDVVNATSGIPPASAIPFSPTGSITSTNVQAAIQEVAATSGGGVTPGDLALKQDLLYSGSNIKTVNGQTLLGSGNLAITGGGGSGTSDYINVMAYGAIGDNIADDTAAIQAALTVGTNTGRTVFFPSGTYKITSGLIAGNTTSFADFGPRVRILGAGSGNTCLSMPTGTFNLLSVGSATGLNVNLSVEGLFLQGPGSTGTGLRMTRMPYFKISDVVIKGFGYGVLAADILSGSFNNCKFLWNERGVRAYRNTFSEPNAVSFYDCVFGNNFSYGLTTEAGTIVSVNGGSIEGNGLGGIEPFLGGMFATTGQGGAQGVNLSGVYFEHNRGTADVYLVATQFSASHSIVGCTFNRIDSTRLVGHNILVETVAGLTQHVAVIGCGFKRLGDYIANGSRVYIQSVNSGSSQISWSACYFQDAIEFPLIPNYNGSNNGRIAVTLNSLGINTPSMAFGTDSSGSTVVTVTYVTPFRVGTTPKVITQPVNNTGGASASIAEVYNNSNTGFTIRKYSITAGTITGGTFTVDWTATGEG